MELTLKKLSAGSIPQAMEKVELYRNLNQPEEAESICRDILDVDPDHKGALRALGLALTDQFPESLTRHFTEAMAVLARLDDSYERTYYTGVAWERAGKSQLSHGELRNAAVSFRNAMRHFAEAGELRPEHADPVLRWNRCVRMFVSNATLGAALVYSDEDRPTFGD